MAYAAFSVSFGEQPSAAKWNILGTNDSSFNDGSGLPIANSKSATVVTSETTASLTYTDLSTPGPAVTATIGASGMALVILTASLTNSVVGDYASMSFAASGANTIAANDARALYSQQSGTGDKAMSWAYLATGLTPGSTVFTSKYESITGGTSTFLRRYIAVITL